MNTLQKDEILTYFIRNNYLELARKHIANKGKHSHALLRELKKYDHDCHLSLEDGCEYCARVDVLTDEAYSENQN